jgi:class 3 adenylate cyclase/TolB-like protein/Flp pilus assembly protein TadD
VSETRKLVAILVADIVGYSRLAGADEDRILARLRTLRSDLIDPILAVHHGRVVKRTGDGAIIEFRSVVDAVRCAIEVQSGLAERNAGLPPDKRIEYRVGIHLGDVVEESDGDLMGDGVNIAARLEGVAKPGAICLSEQAYWQVKGRLDLKVSDLGLTQLKNIAEPVHVYSLEVGQPAQARATLPTPAAVGTKSGALPPSGTAFSRWPALAITLIIVVLAAGIFAWRAGVVPRLPGVSATDDKLASAPRLSIVVLPLENLSGDKEQDYFADGITDDLTTDLSHLPESFVISRGTAFTYKGKPIDAKAIGRELGVRYLLEGSVRRLGEKVEVNAQLISTETGAHVWADRFEGERSKLGELQVDVVARLANSLGVELVKAEALRGARERPNNPDAVDLAMRGDAARLKGPGAANEEEALGYYERALRLDPDLVRAQVGVARGLARRTTVFKTGNPDEDLPRAEALAMKALSAEPDNPQAHQARASVMFARNQFSDALAELRGVIENNSNLAGAYADYGATLTFNGQAAEAIPQIETALRLSPRDPELSSFEFYMCSAYTHLAQWEKTVEWCKKSIAARPSLWLPYMHLAAANGWLGRDAEAKTAIADLLKLRPDFTVQQFANMKWSDNPQYQREYVRIIEGLRKAGVPEGEKKTN